MSENSSRTYTLVTDGWEPLISVPEVSAEKFQIARIFQGTGARMIRLTFAAGQVMREHSTNVPLIVQMLEGELLFRIDGDELRLTRGSILHVEPGIMHELEAVTESHVLLTQTL
ncbi:MAG: cupin domain-containing protein [Leucobacter sp.]